MDNLIPFAGHLVIRSDSCWYSNKQSAPWSLLRVKRSNAQCRVRGTKGGVMSRCGRGTKGDVTAWPRTKGDVTAWPGTKGDLTAWPRNQGRCHGVAEAAEEEEHT